MKARFYCDTKRDQRVELTSARADVARADASRVFVHDVATTNVQSDGPISFQRFAHFHFVSHLSLQIHWSRSDPLTYRFHHRSDPPSLLQSFVGQVSQTNIVITLRQVTSLAMSRRSRATWQGMGVDEGKQKARH